MLSPAPLRILFAGSPSAAVPSLKLLGATRHNIALVITRVDSPQGRRRVLTPTPVAVEAERQNIPVLKTNRLSADAATDIETARADLGVIVAYGALVREPILSTPRLGWINLHFSLLPRWRGAAPVQRAIMAGDDVTGASVFQLVPELDAGDVFGRVTESVGAHQTAGHLLESLAGSGAQLLAQVVDAIADGTAQAQGQQGDVTLAPKLGLPDGDVDFDRPATAVFAMIRGVTPEPGAFTSVDGGRLKIMEAAPARDAPPQSPGLIQVVGGRILIGTATEPLELVRVLPAGRKSMDALAWWRGRPAGELALASMTTVQAG